MEPLNVMPHMASYANFTEYTASFSGAFAHTLPTYRGRGNGGQVSWERITEQM